MKKLKLVTIVGTRPELIKLSLTIKKCDKIFDHVLIHTGQNYDYELNQIFFKPIYKELKPLASINQSGCFGKPGLSLLPSP